MTEKSYGGNNGIREHLGSSPRSKNKPNLGSGPTEKKSSKKGESDSKTNFKGYDDYIKAGIIAKEVRDYARSIIKKDMLLLDIARIIDKKIFELGGELAFPVNLSIDDIAAHYHPTIEDETKANGLLKVDIGVHIKGFIADTAFSIDLTEDNKYKDLIKSSELALENALSLLEKNPNSTLNEIGETIQKSIQDKGFSPIINLSGHALDKFNLHAGLTIPNYANSSPHTLETGGFAIEPFATLGEGRVYDGPSSNIYKIINLRNVRGPTARKILEYFWDKYQSLPFSLREVQEKFGGLARLGVKELEQAKIIHNFPQLIEKSHKPVSQAEHTIIKTSDGKIIITTR